MKKSFRFLKKLKKLKKVIFEVSDDVLMMLLMMILMMMKNSVLGVKKGVFLRGQKRGVLGSQNRVFEVVEELKSYMM